MENPLLNLIFAEDTPGASYRGTQTGNKLVIDGFIWTTTVSGPEIGFMNIPSQLLGETLTINIPFSEQVTSSSIVTEKDNKDFIPYKYDTELLYTNTALDFITKQSEQSISQIVQGKDYEITVSWYDFTATYYVRFDLDPTLIKKGSSYNYN